MTQQNATKAYLDYVSQQEPWARGYLESAHERENGVFVSNKYLHICRNPTDAVMLSKIVYWHGLSKNGHPRLSYQRDGHYWLLKPYSEWQDDLCFSSVKMVRGSISRLEKLGVIVKTTVKSPFHDGSSVIAIRIDWKGLGEKLNQYFEDTTEDKDMPKKSSKGAQKVIQGCPKGHSGVPKRASKDDQKGIPIYTLSTTLTLLTYIISSIEEMAANAANTRAREDQDSEQNSKPEKKTKVSEETIDKAKQALSLVKDNSETVEKPKPKKKAKTTEKSKAETKTDPNKPNHKAMVTAIEQEMIKCGKWKAGAITKTNYGEAGSLAKELIALDEPVWPEEIPSYFEWVLEQDWSSWTLHALKKHVSDWREWEEDDYVQPPPIGVGPGIVAPADPPDWWYEPEPDESERIQWPREMIWGPLEELVRENERKMRGGF